MRYLVSLLFLSIAFAPAHAAEAETPRLITVNGQGKVMTVPDRASISMTIESRNPTLQPARDDVNRRVNQFLQEIDKLAIDRKRIRNSGLVVRPEYRWNKADKQQQLKGYYVARQIHIDLHELDKLGPLLERTVTAGVNQVSPPQFSSSRAADLKRVALSRAASDARLNAAAIAENLNSRLGAVHSISAQHSYHQPPMPMRGRMMAMADESAGSAEQGYETGEISFSATVTVSFDLIDGL